MKIKKQEEETYFSFICEFLYGKNSLKIKLIQFNLIQTDIYNFEHAPVQYKKEKFTRRVHWNL